jgi:hypothetical protein
MFFGDFQYYGKIRFFRTEAIHKTGSLCKSALSVGVLSLDLDLSLDLSLSKRCPLFFRFVFFQSYSIRFLFFWWYRKLRKKWWIFTPPLLKLEILDKLRLVTSHKNTTQRKPNI